jgi:hypothetical protein
MYVCSWSLGGGNLDVCRYLRLTPLYAYILLMYGTVVVHLGEGPVWFRLEREAANCRTQWWTNLV